MLFVRVGDDLINLGAVTRATIREDADGVDVRFITGDSVWLAGAAAAVFLEELVNLHDGRQLVLRNRPDVGPPKPAPPVAPRAVSIDHNPPAGSTSPVRPDGVGTRRRDPEAVPGRRRTAAVGKGGPGQPR